MITLDREWDTMFPKRIETERLHLEQISHNSVDVFDLHEFYSDGADVKEMFEYWDSSPHETVKETYDYIDEAERLWEGAEGAKYVIRPMEGEDGAGVIAGTTGLYSDWEKRSANLGILLDERFWGRGYSGERADAMLAIAFDRLDLELVVAPTSTATRSHDEQPRSMSTGTTADTMACCGTGCRWPIGLPTCTDTPSHETSMARRSSKEFACSYRSNTSVLNGTPCERRALYSGQSQKPIII